MTGTPYLRVVWARSLVAVFTLSTLHTEEQASWIRKYTTASTVTVTLSFVRIWERKGGRGTSCWVELQIGGNLEVKSVPKFGKIPRKLQIFISDSSIVSKYSLLAQVDTTLKRFEGLYFEQSIFDCIEVTLESYINLQTTVCLFELVRAQLKIWTITS